MEHMDTRREIIRACIWMNEKKLNHGASGNVGVRVGGKFLLTPSGMDYDTIEPADIVEMGFDGSYTGNRIPSTEWRFHSQILERRPEFNVVIHTHSMYCTTLAIHGMGIPAVHYMVAAAGGNDIRCAPYVTPTTKELADVAVKAIESRKACLLQNHGLIVANADMNSALKLLSEVENLAEQYWRALQIGKPNVLSEAQMREVFGLLETYGRQPDPKLRKVG